MERNLKQFSKKHINTMDIYLFILHNYETNELNENIIGCKKIKKLIYVIQTIL